MPWFFFLLVTLHVLSWVCVCYSFLTSNSLFTKGGWEDFRTCCYWRCKTWCSARFVWRKLQRINKVGWSEKLEVRHSLGITWETLSEAWHCTEGTAELFSIKSGFSSWWIGRFHVARSIKRLYIFRMRLEKNVWHLKSHSCLSL